MTGTANRTSPSVISAKLRTLGHPIVRTADATGIRVTRGNGGQTNVIIQGRPHPERTCLKLALDLIGAGYTVANITRNCDQSVLHVTKGGRRHSADGREVTAVAGAPGMYLKKISDRYYNAIYTYDTPIEQIDTDSVVRDDRWGYIGTLNRTVAREYDTREDGTQLAGWYVTVDGNTAEPYRAAAAAKHQFLLQLVDYYQRVLISRDQRTWTQLAEAVPAVGSWDADKLIAAAGVADLAAAAEGFGIYSRAWFRSAVNAHEQLSQDDPQEPSQFQRSWDAIPDFAAGTQGFHQYWSAHENANDTGSEEGFAYLGPRWYEIAWCSWLSQRDEDAYAEYPKELTVATCPNHSNVPDERGCFTDRLPVQPCESGADYGVWTEDDGGFLCTFDCAMQAANFAAGILAEDDEQELKILRECHDHPGQPEDGCEDCFTEHDETADDDADEE